MASLYSGFSRQNILQFGGRLTYDFEVVVRSVVDAGEGGAF